MGLLNDHRLVEFIIDDSTGHLSASRVGLLAMNLVAAVAGIWLLFKGKDPTTLIAGVAATDAGVYLVNSGARVWGRAKEMLKGGIE